MARSPAVPIDRRTIATLFSFRAKLPSLIEVVDTEDKIAAIIPHIDEMVGDGTMTALRGNGEAVTLRTEVI